MRSSEVDPGRTHDISRFTTTDVPASIPRSKASALILLDSDAATAVAREPAVAAIAALLIARDDFRFRVTFVFLLRGAASGACSVATRVVTKAGNANARRSLLR